ncbi:hypothetical protein GYMLUDRAFT_209919, partial [Collybiopsis luxurians FD-317 M1]
MEREEELLKRIDEDDAKIDALERLIGDAHDLPRLKDRLKQCEQQLKSDSLRVEQLEGRNAELVQEREEALDALEAAKRKVQELEGQNKVSSSEKPRCVSFSMSLPHENNLNSSQLMGPDKETVENMQRLLNAVDRLRAERDDLRRDMEFLDMESKFTIAALEAKVASLSQTDVSRDSRADEQQKEIRRLQGLVMGCGIVIRHIDSGSLNLESWYNSACSSLEEKTQKLALTENRLHETESRLTSTIQLLEETTTHRNDVLSRL